MTDKKEISQKKILIANLISNSVLLSIVAALLYIVIGNNTREHNEIKEELKGKVPNEILIQFIEFNNQRWELQQDENCEFKERLKEIDGKIDQIRTDYIARGVRGSTTSEVRYIELGSYIWKHDGKLLSMFKK